MSKRFRDTDIWGKEWYRKFTPEQKCAWGYLCDRCDNVGVISLDREQADYLIGAKIDWDALVKSCNGNIGIIGNGKLWLKDFCWFQYGELTDNNKAHHSYLLLLGKHGLPTTFKGHPSPLDAHKEKEKDKNTLKRGEKIAFNLETKRWDNITEEDVALWEKAYPACDMEQELTKMAVWILENPKKGHKSNWGRFITNWLSRAQDKGGTR